MNENELTSGLQDFFAEPAQTGKGHGGYIGGIGALILHLVVFAFAIYSGYHGISATARYHASNGLGMLAGVVGILVIEFVLIGLYLAFFYRRVTGAAQQIAAAATAALGFALSCLGIVADSQLQAGMALSSWLAAYIAWGLPIAPAFMALGAAVVMGLEPKHLRLMREASQREDFEETKHTARLQAKQAELATAKILSNVQLNGRKDAALMVLAAYRSPEVQAWVKQSALGNMPELMRAIGIHLPYGTVIEGQPVPEPTIPTEPTDAPPPVPTERTLLDRLLGRNRPAPPADNTPANSANDAVRHNATPTPATAPGQGGDELDMLRQVMREILRQEMEADGIMRPAAPAPSPNGQEPTSRPH